MSTYDIEQAIHYWHFIEVTSPDWRQLARLRIADLIRVDE